VAVQKDSEREMNELRVKSAQPSAKVTDEIDSLKRDNAMLTSVRLHHQFSCLSAYVLNLKEYYFSFLFLYRNCVSRTMKLVRWVHWRPSSRAKRGRSLSSRALFSLERYFLPCLYFRLCHGSMTPSSRLLKNPCASHSSLERPQTV